MRGAIPPLPAYVLMVWYFIKHRDALTLNFTFTFTFMLGETWCLALKKKTIWVVSRILEPRREVVTI
jgi:hypothetical protein